MSNTREGLFVRLGRLITMPEQVDKLEERVEHAITEVRKIEKSCRDFVTRKEMVDTIGTHGKIQTEKLGLVIKLLKSNNSQVQQYKQQMEHQAKQNAK